MLHGDDFGGFYSLSLFLLQLLSVLVLAQGRCYLSLPETLEVESHHLTIWPEWDGRQIECRFPTRLLHPAQHGGGWTSRIGCNVQSKISSLMAVNGLR